MTPGTTTTATAAAKEFLRDTLEKSGYKGPF